jgi:CheY-like chemotaxis protein/CRP-like cAMP-binding protein
MIKVLLIEDNHAIRENVVEILELSGYTVTAADNGKTGLELAVKAVPDIILCDIMMPELDGYTVFDTLSKNPTTKAVPFIFLTAKSERSDIRKGMELGADDYLTKPFDDKELLNAIESRLKKQEIYQLFYGKTPERLNDAISKKDGLEQLKEIMQERSSRKLKKNHHIHYEGDRVLGIYFIISGKVKTIKLTEDGREFITGIYKTDDYLDVNIILSDVTYHDTAIAMEDTLLSFLPVEQLDRLLYLYPEIGTRFIKILANHIREKELRLLQLAYLSVRKRIAEALVRLVRHHSHDSKSVKISREDLASLCGTAPETISRTLSDFINEGLIEKSTGTIKILNFEKLKRLKN